VKIFFDVDDTIISSQTGGLRPLVKEVFAALTSDGHEVYVWSAMGLRWIALERHALAQMVVDCYAKPNGRGWNPYVPLTPDFVVDDEAPIVERFGGYCVTPYLQDDSRDRAMLEVLTAVRALTARSARSDRGDRAASRPAD
jgi:hypothetical protein